VLDCPKAEGVGVFVWPKADGVLVLPNAEGVLDCPKADCPNPPGLGAVVPVLLAPKADAPKAAGFEPVPNAGLGTGVVDCPKAEAPNPAGLAGVDVAPNAEAEEEEPKALAPLVPPKPENAEGLGGSDTGAGVGVELASI
jgi:hypothetical protein